MNKIRNFLSRLDRRVLMGVICLVAGICLIALSGMFLGVAIRIAGAILALVSAIRLGYSIKRYKVFAITAEVINSALLFLVGLIIALNPGDTLNLIYATIGAYLTINAVTHIYRLANLPRRARGLSWWVEVLSSALIIPLGIWLIFAPATAQRITEILAGIALIAKSAELLGRAYRERGQRKKQSSNDIEADFVDKSHEL